MKHKHTRWLALLALLLMLTPLVPGAVRADGPFCIPTTGTVTQRFHSGHGGVDIASGTGSGVTPVYAAYAGQVVYRGTMNVGYPLDVAVAINHGMVSGKYVLTHYHHMGHGSTSCVMVNVGDWVYKGQTIGYQGDYPEPETSGVHLHFAVAEMDKPFLNEYTSWGIRCERSDLWYELGGRGNCPLPYPDPAVGVNPESGTYLGPLPGYVAETCSAANQLPNPPPLESPGDGDWINSRTVTLSWCDGGDPDNQPNSFRDYNIVVWDNDGWSAEQGWPVGVVYTATDWTLTVPDDGTYYWHVRAGDGDLAGEWSEEPPRSFGVDTVPPSSSVEPLAAEQENLSFTVHWSGGDATSGVADFDVEYRDGTGGNWITWQSNTTSTSAIFTGQAGHTYYFRSLARDHAGNVEDWPPGDGDTHTTLRARVYLPVIFRNYPPSGSDLVVTGISVSPPEPATGQPATVYVIVKNQGNQPVALGNNFYVDFYVDTVPAPYLIGDIHWGVQGADFGIGQTQTYNVSFTFSGGVHNLYAQVDTDNTVLETDETNNVRGPQSLNVSGLDAYEIKPPPPLTGPRATPTPTR